EQHVHPGEEPRYVVQCNGLEVGMLRKQGGIPKQAPFAVVVGCSDARVPTEMLFGQGFNDLFVIRVAGNVLGDVCLGSIDFAVEARGERVKVLVVLGHSGCGAVTGAVDAYLRPRRTKPPETGSPGSWISWAPCSTITSAAAHRPRSAPPAPGGRAAAFSCGRIPSGRAGS